MLSFGLLNTTKVQEYAKEAIVKELKDKIGTELGIEKLHFQPFNTIELDSVYLYDQSNDKVLIAKRVSAGVDIISLIRGKIVITSAWLSDFEVHLSKKTPDSPLNIQYIIDVFKPKDEKPKTKVDFVLNALNISNGRFYYDIESAPVKENQFDINHVAVSDLSAKLALKSLKSDSLNIQVKKISLKEKSGFELSNLIFRLITQDKKVSVRGFKLDLPASTLALDKCELDLTPINDTAQILDYAKFDCIIASSQISPKDISSLVPSLRHYDDIITIQGHIEGTADDLNIKDISITQKDQVSLIANAEIKDIRDSEKMYILGSIDKFNITNKALEDVINNFSENKKKLPDYLKNLGTVSFEGDISGYLKQLTAFGSLETNLGIIKTDILFGFNSGRGISSYLQGKVYTTGFNLENLTNNTDLGKVSFNLAIEMERNTYGKMKGAAKGSIRDFDYKGYTYEEVTFNTNYDNLKIDGNLNINDPNGSLNINGIFDLSDKDKPDLNFKAQAKNIQLGNLHLVKNLEHSYLSFNIDADFIGKDVDNAEGYVKVDSIDFIREDKLFQLNHFLVNISGLSENKELSIESELIQGKVKGAYSFSSIATNIQQSLQPYLSALVKPNKKKKPDDKDNIFTFDFHINKTDSLSDILKLPVTILSHADIKGAYNNITDKFNLEIYTPSIKAGGMNIKSGQISINNPNDTISATIDAIVIGKKDAKNNIVLASKVNNNIINTDIYLTNDGLQKAKGHFSVVTEFVKEEEEPLLVSINILPSELLLNNAYWKMEKSYFSIQNGTYSVNNFFVYNKDGDQNIKINGKYSNNPRDILKAELKNINLEYIFQTLAIDALQFGGAATGSVFVSTIESQPYANTRLNITDFKFNGTDLGNLNLFSEFDEESKQVVMDGLITSKESKLTKVEGSIDPIKQRLSLNFDADSLDVGFLNKYAQNVFQNITGRGTGNVHLFGDFSNVTVEGKAFIKDGSLGINFLNTRYSFTDTVYMKKDLIYFNNIALIDAYNNRAIASGKVAHDFFRDFMYLVNLSAENFLLYNATPQQNPIFYGKVFGSGNGTIGGDESAVDVDIRMKTEDKTVVRMNFMDESINEYSFITYKNEEQSDSIKSTKSEMLSPIKTDSEMAINMNFYIDATPDAVVELMMDPVGGDILRGSGSGAMQFQWNTKSSPRLFGTYIINRGSYNFTFQRIMERRFTIQDGSTVQFRGDPFEANLDVEAVYKVNASLNDLDKTLAQSAGQSMVTVNCILGLTGPLKHPTIGLDLKFPSTDSEIERQVKNIINTEDEMNKQVAYLLILSKFRAPRGANVDNPTSDFAAVASATLSNQLTKIVSQIDDRWQLGTNIRYNDKEMTYTEAELLLSSQLLNDRLIINGNFGYRNDLNINKEAMVTDIDIEYLLNNAGTWRIKAYNHYNEKYYYTLSATQTQGVGIIYKKDFDDFRELFVRQRKRKPNIADSIKPLIPDSTKKGSSLSHFIRIKK